MRRLFLVAFGLTASFVTCAPLGAQEPRAEKRYTVEMRGVPWKKVLEWLSDQSGLPVSTKHPAPPGTFTLISPNKGKEPMTYSLSEVIDLINDTLSLQGYLLVRRSASIAIVVDDEQIDAALAPHLEVADLKSRGRTELASIAVPLEHFGSAEAAREVRKLMGRFGDVVVLTETKRVVLRDTAENLQRILTITTRAKVNPAPPKGPVKAKELAETPDVLKFVRFVATSNAKNGNEATLLDLARNREYISLRVAPGSADFRIRDFDEKTIVLSGTAVRIDVRAMYFRANDQIYRLNLGENLGNAMERPLNADELKELKLDR